MSLRWICLTLRCSCMSLRCSCMSSEVHLYESEVYGCAGGCLWGSDHDLWPWCTVECTQAPSWALPCLPTWWPACNGPPSSMSSASLGSSGSWPGRRMPPAPLLWMTRSAGRRRSTSPVKQSHRCAPHTHSKHSSCHTSWTYILDTCYAMLAHHVMLHGYMYIGNVLEVTL